MIDSVAGAMARPIPAATKKSGSTGTGNTDSGTSSYALRSRLYSPRR